MAEMKDTAQAREAPTGLARHVSSEAFDVLLDEQGELWGAAAAIQAVENILMDLWQDPAGEALQKRWGYLPGMLALARRRVDHVAGSVCDGAWLAQEAEKRNAAV